jgi:hypothetical protein
MLTETPSSDSEAKLSHGICPDCYTKHWGTAIAAIKARRGQHPGL